jgi:hypothetical protein
MQFFSYNSQIKCSPTHVDMELMPRVCPHLSVTSAYTNGKTQVHRYRLSTAFTIIINAMVTITAFNS